MNKATRTVVSTFGVLAGLPGLAYGYFEILQGNVATSGVLVDAVGPSNPLWHSGPAPVMTLISNFLATGILAILASLLVIIWSAAFIQWKNGGFVLILLSIGQLLVGGGTAQVMLAILVGALATRINRPLTWWSTHLSDSLQCFLAKLWPWLLIASAGLYFLHYAIPIIIGITGSFLGTSDPNLPLMVGYAAIAPFILTVIAGFAVDIIPPVINCGSPL